MFFKKRNEIRNLADEIFNDIEKLNSINKDILRKIRYDMKSNGKYYKNKYGGGSQFLYNTIAEWLGGDGCS